MISVVMLPIAIQIAHAFEKHEYSVSNKQVSINLFDDKTDCSVFHFKINHNSIDFSNGFSTIDKPEAIEKKYFVEFSKYSVKPHSKSSRAPPYLML